MLNVVMVSVVAPLFANVCVGKKSEKVESTNKLSK